MSGGVDSSVAAWILKKNGYQVEGLFMKNWEEDDDDKYCHASKDLKDAQSVCNMLKINLHKVNFSEEYWNSVFKTFIHSIKLGNTPNPDVLCNKEIKFKTFLNFAIHNLSADFIATGHYVKSKYINGINYIIKGIDENKDQSYFLYTLESKIISKVLFPLGDLKKSQVRKIANQLQLVNAKKKDSTGICFIGKKNFSKFISKYLPKKIGYITDIKNNILGKHNGFMYYTIGQRKGLGIGGIKNNCNNNPWYVAEKNVEMNKVIVVQGSNNKYLYSSGFRVYNINWLDLNLINKPYKCFVKTRYRQKEVPCIICLIYNKFLDVYLDKPIKAVTPGQSAVFYINNICLGGGIIKYKFPII